MLKPIFRFQILNSLALLFFLATLCCRQAMALELKNAGLFIKSDKLTINQPQQVATFSGHVVVFLETMQLETTHLNVHYKEIDNQKTIVSIVIPSDLTAIDKVTSEIITADRAKYDVQQNKLTLTGKVKLLKGNSLLVTEEMIYFSVPSGRDQTVNLK